MKDAPHDVVIVGTGPAALVAATLLVQEGIRPLILERRESAAWKLLVAGSSGLNVAWECPEEELASHYPERSEELAACFREFGRGHWLSLLHSLGQETFLGSSRRHFLRSMKAAPLVTAWIERLIRSGATFRFGEHMRDLLPAPGGWEIVTAKGAHWSGRAVLLALGGASWEETPPDWPAPLTRLGLEVKPFAPSNSGWHVDAPASFFREAEGKPIKGARLTTNRGSRLGEMMITRYGLEGTPVYTMGTPGSAWLDLKPDLSEEKLRARLSDARGTLDERILNAARLSSGAWLLVKHLSRPEERATAQDAARLLKRFPVRLLHPRPLQECISSRGGLSWDELDENLESRKCGGLFFAGEMVDWDAPTGGFLLTACASMGAKAARGILKRLRDRSDTTSLSS